MENKPLPTMESLEEQTPQAKPKKAKAKKEDFVLEEDASESDSPMDSDTDKKA